MHKRHWGMAYNNLLKFVPATKSVASTGLANTRRLAGRFVQLSLNLIIEGGLNAKNKM